MSVLSLDAAETPWWTRRPGGRRSATDAYPAGSHPDPDARGRYSHHIGVHVSGPDLDAPRGAKLRPKPVGPKERLTRDTRHRDAVAVHVHTGGGCEGDAGNAVRDQITMVIAVPWHEACTGWFEVTAAAAP